MILDPNVRLLIELLPLVRILLEINKMRVHVAVKIVLVRVVLLVFFVKCYRLIREADCDGFRCFVRRFR